MIEIPSTTATGSIENEEYVAKGTTRLRNGTPIGNATLRVPASAVDPTVVGESAATKLKSALEIAVQALAAHDAKIGGRWPA